MELWRESLRTAHFGKDSGSISTQLHVGTFATLRTRGSLRHLPYLCENRKYRCRRCGHLGHPGVVPASRSRVSLIVSNQPALRLSTGFLSPVQLTVDYEDAHLPMRRDSPMH
jgi:hypothetical protein